MRNTKRKQRLALLSILVLFLFSYPLISVVNKPVYINGIPLLYLYIFIAWLLVIILLYSLTSDKTKRNE